MIITIFGATGMVGKRIIKTALSLGHTVRAFTRNVESLIDEDQRNDNLEAIKGYVFSEPDVFKAVKGAGAVLSALGGGIQGEDKTRSLGIKNIIAQMNKAGVSRIIALGGMGVLSDEKYVYKVLNPKYPEKYKAVGLEHLQAFENLKDSDLDWTFIASPDITDKDATGLYTTEEGYMPDDEDAANSVTAGNLALFMVTEIAADEYVKKLAGIWDSK